MFIDNSCHTIAAAESATILKPDLFTTSKYDPDQVLNSIEVISSHPVLIEASHTSTLPGVVTSTESDTTLRESKKRTYDSPISFSDGHGSKTALVDVSDHLSDPIAADHILEKFFTMKTFYDCGELELAIWFTVLTKMELSMLVIVIWLWCVYYNIIPRLGLDKICFFFFLFCFSFMLDKSTYFAFPIHPFCSLFHPFCFPKIPFLHTVIKVQAKLDNLMSKVVLESFR